MATSFEWGDELPRIQGTRIELRPLEDQDTLALLAIFGDPEVVKLWSFPPLRDLAAANELLDEIRKKFSARTLFEWGISWRETGEAIGVCSLTNLDRAHRRAEVGFALRKDRWGQGLATEALGALLTFSFQTLGLHRIEADVDPNNERSLRTLERQGFRREGHLRERWHHLGAVHDGVFLGLLKREWTGAPCVEGERP